MSPQPLVLFVALLGIGIVRHASAAENQVIDLWPEGVPGFRPDAPKEETRDGHVDHVSIPTLTVVRPAVNQAVPTAVIICPGGSYVRLAMNKEGFPIADWLASHGVTAFVLKYRMEDYGQPSPLRDVLRAVRTVRSRAKEFGLDPMRIGVFGASAGGHLAATAGTMYDSPLGRTGAPIDSVSARPDFLILLYPVMTMTDPYVHQNSRRALLGSHPDAALEEAWSPNLHVTRNTPPAFLAHAEDDKTVPVENTILFYRALRDAGVPAQVNLFEHGSHGFGMRADLGPTSTWPDRCAGWMKEHGWIAQ